MSAADVFLDLVIAAYGEPMPVADGGHVVVIGRRQSELALEFGLSRGTVAKYLRQLRPVVETTAAGDIVVHVFRRAFSGGAPAARRSRRAPDAPPMKGAPAANGRLHIPAGQAGRILVQRPGAPPVKGAPAAQLASFSVSREGKNLASSALGAPSSGGAQDPKRISDDAAIDEAFAALVSYCRRCTPPLPTALDPKGRRALGQYPPAGLAHAAGEVLAEVKAGKIRRSPMGLLVAKARTDPAYFAVPLSGPEAVPVADEEPVAVADKAAALAELRSLRTRGRCGVGAGTGTP